MCINMCGHACTVRVSPDGAEKIEGDGFPAIEHRVVRAKFVLILKHAVL